MRPRKRDLDLPRGVYLRHGSYYLVRRGLWRRLGADKQAAIALVQSGDLTPTKRALQEHLRRVFTAARNNARGRRGLPFTIQFDDMLALAERDLWGCSVTRIPFSLEIVAGKKPYAPSIDRIDSRLGYVVGNCRLVCVAANYAMNVWGEVVLRRMTRSIGGIGRQLDSSPFSP